MANFTQEQMRAIEAQGKTIVSASAGSGKTTVMIEKIIRLIKDGTGVGEILAVTFTKKAAAQMKEKLCKELIEEINRDTTTAERRELLKKQLSEVPGADISTIHSFCAKLLRSHFYLADIDSSFRVIGGDDAEGESMSSFIVTLAGDGDSGGTHISVVGVRQDIVAAVLAQSVLAVFDNHVRLQRGSGVGLIADGVEV